MSYDYDFIVIGGGSGGSGAARRAAYWGAKVALVDGGFGYDDKGVRSGAGVGGTCVNVGCVPKKLMFSAANLYEQIQGHAELASGNGITVAGASFDWATLKKRRDEFVERTSKNYEKNWKKEGITLVLGWGSLVDPHTVEVLLNDGGAVANVTRSGAKKQRMTAKYILVCVGGAPSYPPKTPGAREHCITSDGFWDLEKQPRKCAVVGGGYIAVEMAGILNAFGTETTLLCRGPSPLRNVMAFDRTIVEKLVEQMQHHGPTLLTDTTTTAFVREADGTVTVKMMTKGGEAAHGGFDCVLLAVGRAPLTRGMGLEGCGVNLTDRGHIVVDAFERTNVPSILALGDCTQTGWELTPVALAAARRLADRLFAGPAAWARLAYDTIPTVVFSHPPMGMVGLTEDAAKEAYGAAAVSVDHMTAGGLLYAFNPDDDRKVKTTLKLVHVSDDRRIVGLHILGPCADEMIQGFAVALRKGCTVRDFHATVGLHPTMAEEIVSFGGGQSWGLTKDKSKPEKPPYLDSQLAALAKPKTAALLAALLAAGFFAGRASSSR